MSFFKSLFKKNAPKVSSEKPKKQEKLTTLLKVKEIQRLTPEAVKIVFEVPLLLKEKFEFQPGQYVNLTVEINGKEEPRSYSICSDVTEPLAVGVKRVENGLVSTYLNEQIKVGQKIKVSSPQGNFILPEAAGNFVAIAAGSGITPILSQAKMINRSEKGKMTLIYGNRNDQSIMFQNELENLSPEKVKTIHVLSEQEKENFHFGLLSEEIIIKILKENDVSSAVDGYFICGPEPVLINAKKSLTQLGIPENKIHFELFETPVSIVSNATEAKESDFKGIAKVTIVLDDEEEHFELSTDGDTILEEAEAYGIDAPYSCRGGICSTCKAKVIEGAARMDKNYTLSEKEVEEGYILTCQAHPTTSKIIVNYDE